MKKISTKISVVIIICCCIAILCLGSISLIRGSTLIKSDAEEKLQWMVRQYATQFSGEINIIEEKVSEIALYVKDTIDTEQLYSNPDYLAEYEVLLADYLFNFANKRTDGKAAWCYFNPELSKEPHDVYFVDGNDDGIPDRQAHIPLSYYDNIPTPTDDKQWWYGPIETRDGFWTNPYEWNLSNGEVIKVVSYAYPVFIKDKLIAVVGTYYHFDEMAQKISDIKVYKNGYATLFNEKLDVIINPNYYAGTRNNSDNLQTMNNGQYQEIAKQILETDYGLASYINKADEKSLFAYSKLSNGWIMGVNPPKQEMFEGLYDLIYQLLFVVIICIILSVCLAHFMGIQITKPLQKVVKSANKIGTGDFSVYVDVKTNDEIKVVADSLNNMVTNAKKLQVDLKQLAYYDDLTGIANKNLFKSTALELIKSNEVRYAYIILDVNKFKVINDLFGYAYGDLLIKHIAQVTSAEFHDGELVARYYADNFHILSRFFSREDLEARLYKIASKISAFTFAADTEYHISIGYGIYVIENTDPPLESMGDKAGHALKKVKDFHTTSLFFYNDEIRKRIMEEQEIEYEMVSALERGEFHAYLQPKYSLETETMKGAEALVRWIHPKKGIVPPIDFIGLFERNGFITTLDMYILEEVCKYQRDWIDSGKQPIVISVNQSRLHLHNPDYLASITTILNKYHISTNLIELEITESAFFEDTDKMIEMMNQLHELGFKISMDDFGSGYSSLNMLHEIMVDVLKIDKNFFNESSNTVRGKKIVENIISLATALSITVVAEGVETKEQVDFLKQTGCDLVQGYYYARPMPIDEFIKTQLRP